MLSPKLVAVDPVVGNNLVADEDYETHAPAGPCKVSTFPHPPEGRRSRHPHTSQDCHDVHREAERLLYRRINRI